MARLPGSGFSGKKKKVGFMLRDASLKALNEFKDENEDIVRSPGEAIDYCCELFLDMDGHTAAAAYDILRAGANKVEDSCFDPDLSGFERQQLRIKAKKLGEVAQHFLRLANLDELEENKEPTMRIDLKDGDYVLLPDDGSWAIFERDDAKRHSLVGAISVKSQKDTAIPNIMFFTDTPFGSMSKAECDELINAISKDYPELGEIHEKEIEVAYDAEGNVINAAEWQACPRVGVFAVLDNHFYKSRDEAPGKALVYRVDK